MGFFDTLFAPFTANQSASTAAAAQNKGIQTGLNQLLGSYGQGAGALTSNYTAGLQPFLKNYGLAGPGMTAYGNALGLNGPQGNQAAIEAFWNNPAVAAAIQTGTQNVQRGAAAAGGGQLSGSTLAALQTLGQQTVAPAFQSYLSGLSQYLPFGTASAGGVLQGYGGLGSGLGNLYQSQGQAQAGANAAMGANTASGILGDQASQNAAGSNIWGGILGLGTAALKAFSDVRLKDDIIRVGTLNDGIPIYRYRYKGSPRTEIGVMAQDVEKVRPDAVSEIGGFKAVDYRKATDYAAGLEQFLRAA